MGSLAARLFVFREERESLNEEGGPEGPPELAALIAVLLSGLAREATVDAEYLGTKRFTLGTGFAICRIR